MTQVQDESSNPLEIYPFITEGTGKDRPKPDMIVDLGESMLQFTGLSVINDVTEADNTLLPPAELTLLRQEEDKTEVKLSIQEKFADYLIDADSKVMRDNVIHFLVEKYQNHTKVMPIILRLRKSIDSTKPVNDGFGLYLNETGRYQLLVPDEEVSLFKLVDKGVKTFDTIIAGKDLDAETEQDLLDMVIAHQTLFHANLRLVTFGVKKVQNWQVMELQDLVDEATSGLDKALLRFDVEKGFKFSTYAMWWIKQRARREIQKHARLIPIPAEVNMHISELVIDINELEQKLKSAPTSSEIAESTDKTVEEVNDLQAFGGFSHLSLDAVMSESGDATLGDFVAGVEVFEEPISQLSYKLELEKLCEFLDDGEKLVLSLRYWSYFESLSGKTSFGFKKEVDYDGLFRDSDRTKGLSLQNCADILGIRLKTIKNIEKLVFEQIRDYHAIDISIHRANNVKFPEE